MSSTSGSTLVLNVKEDRRVLAALTKCTPADDDRPSLHHVLFDGRHAYATDTFVVGVLDAAVDLPPELDEDGDVVRDRVVVPAAMLRNALGLAKGEMLVRLRFEPGHLVMVLGDDALPLGDGFDAPTVTIPYGDADSYPTTERIRKMLDGPSGDAVDVVDVATKVGLNAANLARVSALVYRESGGDALVTIHPRGRRRPLEVRSASDGKRVGVMAGIRSMWLDEQEAAGVPA
jgi:hypothetical protein